MDGKPLAGLCLVNELQLHDDALHLLVADVDLERVQHRGPVVVGVSRGEPRSNHVGGGCSVWAPKPFTSRRAGKNEGERNT